MWIRIWRPDYFYLGRSHLTDASDGSPFNRGVSQGFGFFVVGLYWNEGRSVSSDGIHYRTQAVHRVTINGTEWSMTGDVASYERIIAFAGKTAGATVTYRARGADLSGSLQPGQKVLLSDGMVFDAMHTNSA